MSKVIYISGPITGMPDGNYKAFADAEELLEEQGFIVLNPRSLPEGMQQDRYMPIALAMLQQADAIFLLDGWVRSGGAMIERQLAIYQSKEIYYERDLIEEDLDELDEAVREGSAAE